MSEHLQEWWMLYLVVIVAGQGVLKFAWSLIKGSGQLDGFATKDDLDKFMTAEKIQDNYIEKDKIYNTFMTSTRCDQHQALIKQAMGNQSKDIGEIKEAVKEIRTLAIEHFKKGGH
jgi:hypothetical protein